MLTIDTETRWVIWNASFEFKRSRYLMTEALSTIGEILRLKAGPCKSASSLVRGTLDQSIETSSWLCLLFKIGPYLHSNASKAPYRADQIFFLAAVNRAVTLL